jgi:hypothetical protein
VTSTSTRTRAASTPSSAADRTRASTLDDCALARDPFNAGKVIHAILQSDVGFSD